MNQKEFIKRALESTGKKQKEIADITGLNSSTINGYYNGFVEPSLCNLRFLKKGLGFSYEYLLGDSDNQHSEYYLLGKDIGLSDKTIEKLKKYVNRKGFCESDIFYNQDRNTEHYITLINLILENKYIEPLLHWLRVYINIPAKKYYEKILKIETLNEKIQNETDEIELDILNQELYDLENDSYEKEFLEENGYSLYELTSDSLNEAKYKISEIFMKMIDDIFNENKEKMKEKWTIEETKYGIREVVPICKDGSEKTIIGYKYEEDNDER